MTQGGTGFALRLGPPAGYPAGMVRRWQAWLALAMVAVAAYHGALGLSLHSDDFNLIADGADWGLAGGGFLRPAVLLLLHLARAVFGWWSLPFHAVVLAVHVANCWLLYELARRWLGSSAGALAGAALFAVHPIASEAVIWVSALTSSLATLWILAAVLLWDRMLTADGRRRQWGWAAASLACTAGGLLTKESAVLLGPLLVAVCLVRRPRTASVRGPLLALGALLGVYLGFYVVRADAAVASEFGLGYHVFRNLRHLLLSALTLRPFQDQALVHLDHLLRLTDLGAAVPPPDAWPGDLVTAGAAAVLATVVIIVAWSRWLGLGLAWIAITGATLYLRPFHVLDWSYPFPSRLYYLPLVGVALVAAAIVAHALQSRLIVVRGAVLGLVGLGLAIGILGVHARLEDWRQASRLVERTLASFGEQLAAGVPADTERIVLIGAVDHYREAFVFRNGLGQAIRSRYELAVPVVVARDETAVRSLMGDETVVTLWWDPARSSWRRLRTAAPPLGRASSPD